jgi:hypothetical protein
LTKSHLATATKVKLLTVDTVKINKVMIGNAIDKAFLDYDKNIRLNFESLLSKITDLKQPMESRLNDMKAETESYARQNNKFLSLYRQSIAESLSHSQNSPVNEKSMKTNDQHQLIKPKSKTRNPVN